MDIKNKNGDILKSIESNNLRDADLSHANLRDADLSDADLIGANLIGADLSYANLRGANLRGADLSYADLSDADLSHANLRDADLSYANLFGANLRGANLRDADFSYGKAKNIIFIQGLYRYIVISYITTEDVKRLKLGCFDRTIEEWEQNFWNNDTEFPNDDSLKSNLRFLAFETAKKWFELILKQS